MAGYLAKALQVFMDVGYRAAQAQVYRQQAELAAAKGNKDFAKDLFKQARQIYQALGLPLELARVDLSEGSLHDSQCATFLKGAQESFQKLGLASWA
jgi:hypothetical protein